MSTKWQNQRERGSPLLLRWGRWIALNMGRAPARIFIYPSVLYFLLVSAKGRRFSRSYLSRVLQRPIGIRHIAKHFYYFASTIADRVFFVTGKIELFDTKIHNPEVLLNQVQQRQGCILMGSHLGSFEALRAMGIMHKKLPLKVLMYKQPNEAISKLLYALNPEIANSVLPLGKPNTLLLASEFVEQGGIVGMLADRVDNPEKVVKCRFLGTETDFPTGPMVLAATLKVPVILIFGLHRGGNRYELHFEMLADQITLSRKQREQDIQQWMQQYVDRLEHYCRSAPYNWFNFYDYWNEHK